MTDRAKSGANILDIRPYAPGDEDAIQDLFQKSYGRSLPLEVWRWRFQDNPAGPAIIELAWDGPTLAGHYAVSRVALRARGRDVATGLSGTTMTHPGYRGIGLFPALARRTYECMRREGMAMVWGFPNANSHRGFVQDLGWMDISEIPFLRLSMEKASPWAAVSDAFVELAEVDGRFDSLWEAAAPRDGVSVRRDCRHLTWRFESNPTETYRTLACVEGGGLKGYAVFKRYDTEIQIVDILAADTDTGSRIVSRMVEMALSESASAVCLWLNCSDPLHWALERRGFVNGAPVTYFGGLALEAGFEACGAYDFRNWYLTMGDSDVY
jgi:GNAT superfamily N-acetyltransferase